ncbi:cupin domain-containing protein [Novosphingobium sp.]|uniref:cupin domain-containing protein n=1 Tax=Novosphingobium sp. TaxID=1874826 RepID=UPI0031DE371D
MMKRIAAALLFLASTVPAQAAPERPEESKKIAFMQALPNVPGKSLIAVEVTYPPRGASPAHRHAPSAFIFAYVISGEIRSSVDDAPPRVFKAGESWFENPGAHHGVSENASDTEPARLLAVFVADSDDHNLVIPDHH